MINQLWASRPVWFSRLAATCAAGTFIIISASAPFSSDSRRMPNVAASDSSDVAAVVVAYHTAIAAGDSVKGLALLALDAVIVESGGIETREEFRAHHLPADMAFAQAVKGERGPIRVVVQGDVAWASSTSISQGEFRSRPINSSSAELMVLSRGADGWRIRAIHWSSRPRRS